MYETAILAILSLVLSALSLVVSIGVAVRLQRSGRHKSSLGLPVGSQLPKSAFAGVLPASEAEAWQTGRGIVLFMSSFCRPCKELVASLNGNVDQMPAVRLMVVEPYGEGTESLRDTAKFSARWVADPNGQLRTAFANIATPFGYLIDRGKVVQTGGAAALVEMVSKARLHPALEGR